MRGHACDEPVSERLCWWGAGQCRVILVCAFFRKFCSLILTGYFQVLASGYAFDISFNGYIF